MKRFSPVAASHTIKMLEDLPMLAKGISPRGLPEAETMKRPSLLIAQPLTLSPCPSKMKRSAPVAASQTLSVRSAEAETMKRPSELTAQQLTEAVWPCNVRCNAENDPS